MAQDPDEGGEPLPERGDGALPHPTSLRSFQRHIEAVYGARDAARGLAGTFMWFTEEVGELARAIRAGDPENLRVEVGDVLAWLATLASLNGIDLEDAAERYAAGCPRCGAVPCDCRRGPART